MIPDNSLRNGYCLREGNGYYVFYKEETENLVYTISGKRKKVIAIDTRKAYQEIILGKMSEGTHTFRAPYVSDWAIAAD